MALALVAGLALAGCASYGGSPYGSYPGNDGYYPGGYGTRDDGDRYARLASPTSGVPVA